MLCFTTGCASWYTEKRVITPAFGDLQAIADDQGGGRGRRGLGDGMPGRGPQVGFAILLAEFEGGTHQKKAQRLSQRLVIEALMKDVWVQTDESRSRVLRGHYPAPDVDAAVHDLQEVRAAIINGSSPYQDAGMIALGGDGLATSDPFDLRNYPGAYSLQIGFYDRDFGQEFRQAAIDAASVMREEGEQVFFYHGPNMSMVCIGLFDNSDVQQHVQKLSNGDQIIATTYSERVQAYRRKYPYNLGNGNALVGRVDSGADAPLQSFLVGPIK